MSVSRTDQDLNTSDVFKLHKSGIRLDPKSHISIIINTELRQSEIYVGQFLKKYVSDNRSQEIEKQIQLKMNENEIILAMEIGMRKVCESFK